MVNTGYKFSASPDKWENNKNTQSNMVLYLEKRVKDLEQEEQEFRNMVMNQKYTPIKNQHLILEDSKS